MNTLRIALLFAGSLAATVHSATTYDLQRDFSVGSNPNGVWSYGYYASVGGTFTLMNTARTNEVPSVPLWSWSVGGFSPPDVHFNAGTNSYMSDGGTFPPGSLWICPGPEGTMRNYGVMRFTVPPAGAGSYRVEAAVQPYIDGPLDGDTDFHVARNGVELFGLFLAAHAASGYTNQLALGAGDTIDFVIGRGQDGLLAGSCLKLRAVLTPSPTVPSPGDYDLSRDYSATNNPGGPWSYGAKPSLSGPFSIFGIHGTSPADGGVPIQYWQLVPQREPTIFHNGTTNTATITGGQGTLPPGTTYLISGTDGVSNGFGAVRFTAPASGTYLLHASARPLYNTALQGDTDYHVVKNGTELFGAFLAGQQTSGYSNTLALVVGDTIDFMVGRGADNSGFASSLKLDARLSLATNAVLPTAHLRLGTVPALAGSTVLVPLEIVARGDENAFSFSLEFNPSLLSFRTVSSSAPAGSTLIVNSNDAGAGRIGIVLALPPSMTIPAGTQQLVRIEFQAGNVIGPAPVSFSGSPVSKQVSDAFAHSIPADYAPGTVTIMPGGFEADIAPRPGGDGAIEAIDLVLIGRFAANLETPSPLEFARADCAPRATGGNGIISTADFVQAARYVAALDPATPTGGPLAPVAGLAVFRPAADSPRIVKVSDAMVVSNSILALPLGLDAQGDENALGFSINFDPGKLTLLDVAPGSDAVHASLNLNWNSSAVGKLGCLVALPAGQTFVAGKNEVLRLSFRPAENAAGSGVVALGDDPVLREVVNANAESQAASFVAGTVAFGIGTRLGPSLSVIRSGDTLVLAWPKNDSAFHLEGTAGPLSATWELIPSFVLGDQFMAVVPCNSGQRFFRLKSP